MRLEGHAPRGDRRGAPARARTGARRGGEDAPEVLVVETRGQANVGDRHRRLERMVAAVQAPGASIETQPVEKRADERLLALDRKRPLEDVLVRPALPHRLDERYELL